MVFIMLGQGDPVRRRLSFEHIGRSPDSSISYVLNSAATSGYGVIKGGKNASHLELTQNGKRIAEHDSNEERREAALDVLFNNTYFSALIEKYAERPIPQDSIAIDYLQREHSLEQSDAETLWNVAKDNILDFGLYEESRGKQIILARDDAANTDEGSGGVLDETTTEQGREEETVEENSAGNSSEIGAGAPGNGILSGSRIVPQVAFNIQVVLPEDATAETYDAIFESMAVHLLGRNEG